MLVQVEFIDDLIRQKAADSINKQFGTSVSKDQIHRMPTSRLWVRMKQGDRVTALAGEAQTIQKTDVVEIRLEGTEDQLRALVDEDEKRTPDVSLSYDIHGFKVSQNILLVSLHSLVRLRYHHILTGQSAVRIFQEQGLRGDSADVHEPLDVDRDTNEVIGYAKADFSGWVTREQLKEVVHECEETLIVHGWIERPESQDRQRIEDGMVARLTERAYKTDELMIGYQLDGKGGIHLIAKDLAPNQVKSLTSAMSQLNDRKNSRDKSNKEERDNEKRETVEKLNRESRSEITWALNDEVDLIVPKSIRVYYFDNSSFTKMFTSVHAESLATRTELRERYARLVFTRQVPAATEQLVLRRSERITARDNPDAIRLVGGDWEFDTAGGNTQVTCKLTVSFTSESIVLDVYYRVFEAHENHSEALGTKRFVYPKERGLEIIDVAKRRRLEFDRVLTGGLNVVRIDRTGTFRQGSDGNRDLGGLGDGVLKLLGDKLLKLTDDTSEGTCFEEKLHLLVDGPNEDDRPFVGYEFTVNLPYTVITKPSCKEFLIAGEWRE
jgi:hypothetical protein